VAYDSPAMSNSSVSVSFRDFRGYTAPPDRLSPSHRAKGSEARSTMGGKTGPSSQRVSPAEQGPEARLLEVVVAGERLGQP
jgi:hypothetical protein